MWSKTASLVSGSRVSVMVSRSSSCVNGKSSGISLISIPKTTKNDPLDSMRQIGVQLKLGDKTIASSKESKVFCFVC